MVNRGWLSLVAGIALALAGCGQTDSSTGQGDGAAEILSATESFKDFGDYVLHFNALTTDQLSPNIAAEYDIVRSTNRVLLNVSILQNREIGLATATAGEVKATARNLTGQIRNIPIKEIREGDAIYYVGETSIVNAESLVFTVEATLEAVAEPLTVSFQKQFFVDEP